MHECVHTPPSPAVISSHSTTHGFSDCIACIFKPLFPYLWGVFKVSRSGWKPLEGQWWKHRLRQYWTERNFSNWFQVYILMCIIKWGHHNVYYRAKLLLNFFSALQCSGSNLLYLISSSSSSSSSFSSLVLAILLIAVFLNHQTQNFLKNPNWLRLLACVFYHCLRFQRLTWMWLMMSRCPHPSLESTWAPNLYVFNQIWKKTAQALKYINKLFWKWYPHTTAMFRFLRMVPKAMRRLLLQQCRLLTQILPSHID